MTSELERIRRIRRAFGQSHAAALVGIGDDAAVLHAFSGNTVLSVDASVEGVHFRRTWAGLDVIAARAFSAAISDLAAMGAQPRAALCAFVLPQALSDAELDRLLLGFARASERYACPIVGGNLARGSELSLTTTVIGEAGERVLLRSGAQRGDRIFVTGSLGGAAMGVSLLESGRAEHGPAYVAHCLQPCARIAEGLQLRTLASAAIDISDGVLQDLGQLCAASNVGAELWADALPLPKGLSELSRELGHDALELALCGGEDYELLYTVPVDAALTGPGTQIGVIHERVDEIRVRDAHGQLLALEARGYQHFTG